MSGFLTSLCDDDSLGKLDLPESLPVYKIRLDIIVYTGDIVPKDGIFIPLLSNASAQLKLQGSEMMEALVGLSDSGLQFKYRESTQWILVERIADQGGENTEIEV
ncbi:hypothetical protein EC844_101183 [Acinetobacter calcoaceticus]|uniref:Uncharacterized protein n=1 Tax=Acinetobacter calcoaceticus TaxID=471 RepID=A0A4R1Y3M2_ACICA|nr:hypothetical protein EC844_101183 [Acinetobacter calcoaceticus]